ncbi:MAG TPA: hypothetical protein VEG44_00140 [Candidatus Acidoferrales bacterium]|nr:hypothetical protein [Candidatus Acidoferrales bacterium]
MSVQERLSGLTMPRNSLEATTYLRERSYAVLRAGVFLWRQDPLPGVTQECTA